MPWYQEHRDALQAEFPDAAPAELTKLAMRRYRESNVASTASTNKRKLSADDGREPNGVSKLAKFGFSKN